MAVRPVPEGFNTLSCYLVVPNSKEALDFYAKAFGAEGGFCMEVPGGGGVMHAEMRIGNSTFMLTDTNPQWHKKSPADYGGSPVSMHLYVDDADKLFQRAVDAGCQVTCPPTDMFWGDRYAQVVDKFGHTWGIATHTEDVPPEQMATRAAEWFKQMGADCGAGG